MASKIIIPLENVVDDIEEQSAKRVVVVGGRKKDREKLKKILKGVEVTYEDVDSDLEKYRETCYILDLENGILG